MQTLLPEPGLCDPISPDEPVKKKKKSQVSADLVSYSHSLRKRTCKYFSGGNTPVLLGRVFYI